MTPRPSDAQLEARLYDYLADALDEVTRREFEAFLAEHPAWRSRLERERALEADLHRVAPPTLGAARLEALKARVREQVQAGARPAGAANATSHAGETAGGGTDGGAAGGARIVEVARHVPERRRQRGLAGWAAAAAVVIVVLFVARPALFDTPLRPPSTQESMPQVAAGRQEMGPRSAAGGEAGGVSARANLMTGGGVGEDWEFEPHPSIAASTRREAGESPARAAAVVDAFAATIAGEEGTEADAATDAAVAAAASGEARAALAELRAEPRRLLADDASGGGAPGLDGSLRLLTPEGAAEVPQQLHGGGRGAAAAPRSSTALRAAEAPRPKEELARRDAAPRRNEPARDQAAAKLAGMAGDPLAAASAPAPPAAAPAPLLQSAPEAARERAALRDARPGQAEGRDADMAFATGPAAAPGPDASARAAAPTMAKRPAASDAELAFHDVAPTVARDAPLDDEAGDAISLSVIATDEASPFAEQPPPGTARSAPATLPAIRREALDEFLEALRADGVRVVEVDVVTDEQVRLVVHVHELQLDAVLLDGADDPMWSNALAPMVPHTPISTIGKVTWRAETFAHQREAQRRMEERATMAQMPARMQPTPAAPRQRNLSEALPALLIGKQRAPLETARLGRATEPPAATTERDGAPIAGHDATEAMVHPADSPRSAAAPAPMPPARRDMPTDVAATELAARTPDESYRHADQREVPATFVLTIGFTF